MPKLFKTERRQYGTWTATRLLLRRRIELIGFAILAIGVAVALASVHTDAVQRAQDAIRNQAELKSATTKAIYAACVASNDTRKVIRGIIESNGKLIRLDVRTGAIQAAAAQSALVEAHKNIRELHDRNCQKVAHAVNNPTSSHQSTSFLFQRVG